MHLNRLNHSTTQPLNFVNNIYTNIICVFVCLAFSLPLLFVHPSACLYFSFFHYARYNPACVYLCCRSLHVSLSLFLSLSLSLSLCIYISLSLTQTPPSPLRFWCLHFLYMSRWFQALSFSTTFILSRRLSPIIPGPLPLK